MWACLYAGVNAPHDPYVVPQKYLDLYRLEDIPLPENYFDDMRDKPGICRRLKEQVFGQLSEREVREGVRHFWAFCSYIDDLFGRVLDALENTGQAENHDGKVDSSDKPPLVFSHLTSYKGGSPLSIPVRSIGVIRLFCNSWVSSSVATGVTMYIRAKHSGNRTYYTLVKTERKDGKVRQRYLFYLGRHSTVQAAVTALEKHVEETRKRVSYHLNRYWDMKETFHKEQLDRLEARYDLLTAKLARLKALEKEM